MVLRLPKNKVRQQSAKLNDFRQAEVCKKMLTLSKIKNLQEKTKVESIYFDQKEKCWRAELKFTSGSEKIRKTFSAKDISVLMDKISDYKSKAFLRTVSHYSPNFLLKLYRKLAYCYYSNMKGGLNILNEAKSVKYHSCYCEL